MPIWDSLESLGSWGLLLIELIDSTWFWFIEEFPIDMMLSFDFYIEFDSSWMFGLEFEFELEFELPLIFPLSPLSNMLLLCISKLITSIIPSLLLLFSSSFFWKGYSISFIAEEICFSGTFSSILTDFSFSDKSAFRTWNFILMLSEGTSTLFLKTGVAEGFYLGGGEGSIILGWVLGWGGGWGLAFGCGV